MLKRLSAIVLVVALFASIAQAYFESAQNTPLVMNDIRFADYAGFDKKWRLVTVRYREDNRELRFTYANEIAWKAMFSLKPDYPDGAVFAKTAILTENDPSFTSSKVPSASVRYQYMVRNKKKYKDTDGWGYALFDAGGKTFPGDLKVASQACAACHQIVPERDFVFSRPFQKEFFEKTGHREFPKGKTQAITFMPKSRSDFSGPVASLIGDKQASVESLEGSIQKNAFSGTLDEAVPLLLEQSKKFARDSILYVNADNFSLVQFTGEVSKCDASQGLKHMKLLVHHNAKKVREADFCK